MDKDPPLSDDQKRFIQEIVNRKATIPENIAFVGAVIAVGGFVVFLIEAFQYLKSGIWPNWIMLSTVNRVLPYDLTLWLNSPDSWLGLHTLVISVLTANTSVGLLLGGGVIHWIGRLLGRF